ncbi:kinase-like domain-containing protein [Mycena belliarum]|uniref:Serine/threonine-protein kinase n=1 Tax=Mycena belliarum TaxID=1033014 RepID=A0AAD6XQ46_9AGAR|nr:kinase-like domain-containing protein [Mycena belliae]
MIPAPALAPGAHNRRAPLTTTDTNAAAPHSPPLTRQNSKTTPPSPPKHITDKLGNYQFTKVGFLGEGGFARVYEVKDISNKRFACKVVTLSSLKTKKAKTKLYAEIKIHRSLSHPNIVNFLDCFDGDDNVYMTLELCPSGSLMDLLRRRKRFTEPEARFFMVQLIGACHYMHGQSVIHRDLKLGNLFLDAHMNIKVGDFGLAALIESPGERKKTICGTPNYIAPEVLFDTASGHSFEVDTWSIGVILYTLVIGRPPFQTKDVKAIYQRIRNNDYAFPSPPPASPSIPSRNLIGDILTPNPQLRPTLLSIVGHEWFTMGPVPPYIPTSAHDAPPEWGPITRERSDTNLAKLRRHAGLDGHEETVASGVVESKTATSTIARQESEFQKAVQPGSPISALLSSARQPLVRGVGGSPLGQSHQNRPPIPGYSSANPSTGSRAAGDGLYRKLQAAGAKSPLRNATTARRGLNDIIEEDGGLEGKHSKDKRKLKNETELESQKARIVVQMAPSEERVEDRGKYTAESMRGHARASVREQENLPPLGASRRTKGIPKDIAPPVIKEAPSPFIATAETLTTAFAAYSRGQCFPQQPAEHRLPDERVFIVSWVDYCNKYGMGYALTDGSVGVHFNDSTSMVLSCDKIHFDYISPSADAAGATALSAPSAQCASHTVTTYPSTLKSKVYLLKHFERYIMDRLYGEYPYTYEDLERKNGMDWVVKYLRMKHVIVFLMSHGALQFNFYDHSKIILSSHGLVVTHIDKNYCMTKWTLRQIVKLALNGQAGMEREEAKLVQKLMEKLKYCKEVLTSIQAATGKEMDGAGAFGGGEGQDLAPDPHFQTELMGRGSKVSLR